MTVLVTVLGTQARETTYELDGRRIDACLAPEALVQLLPSQSSPWTVVCVCTAAAAEKTYTTLERRLGAMQMSPSLKRIDIPDGLTRDEVEEAIGTMVSEVVSFDDPEVIVDLTHGPRHLAALAFVLALYVNALKGRRVQHVYYANLQQNSPSPLIDLGMLLRVVDWTYAVQAFQTTGSMVPMADLLERDGKSKSVTHVRSVDMAYRSGLPLELGKYIDRLNPKGLQKAMKAGGVPLSVRLRDLVCDVLHNFRLKEPVEEKTAIALTRPELERQHCLVDSLLQQGHYVAALELMNEWTISWFLFQEQPTECDWLEKKVRQQANWKLRTLENISKDGNLAQEMLSEEQRELGRFLGTLSVVRNGLAHNGMRPEDMVKSLSKEISKIKGFWDKLLAEVDTVDLNPLAQVAKGTVLVTPLGKESGVLFSALRLCDPEPDSCVVICSQETEANVEEAANRAGFGGEFDKVVMSDPYGGIGEIEDLAKRETRRILAAERVRVNVTGGTTVMGIAAERLAQLARDYARPIRRFALLDRRPPEEQKRDPYVGGEIVWLDKEG